MAETAVTTDEEMVARLVLAAHRNEGNQVGGYYLRGAHDSLVHAFSPCPRMMSLLYVKGEVALEETMFKKCPVCWPVLELRNNEA